MISQRITKVLIKSSIIEKDQFDLYLYSIKSLLGNILNIIACLLIGVACGEFVKSLIFLIIMIPLRSSTGGCHLKSAIWCFVASCALVFLCLLLPRYMTNSPQSVYMIVITISLGIITIISPVDCITKPISQEEKKRMHVRVRWIAVFIEIMYITAMILDEKAICGEILLMCFYSLGTLFIEKIRKVKVRNMV